MRKVEISNSTSPWMARAKPAVRPVELIHQKFSLLIKPRQKTFFVFKSFLLPTTGRLGIHVDINI